MRHSILLVLIVASVSLCGQRSSFLHDYKEKFTGQVETLTTCVGLLDDKDLEQKPNNENMNARDLVIHICRNMTWISSDYLQGGKFESPFEHKDLSKEELQQFVQLSTSFATQSIAGVDAHLLETRIDFFAGEKNIRQMLQLLDDHLSHHKGQLTVYLRSFGKEPPRYRGW